MAPIVAACVVIWLAGAFLTVPRDDPGSGASQPPRPSAHGPWDASRDRECLAQKRVYDDARKQEADEALQHGLAVPTVAPFECKNLSGLYR